MVIVRVIHIVYPLRGISGHMESAVRTNSGNHWGYQVVFGLFGDKCIHGPGCLGKFSFDFSGERLAAVDSVGKGFTRRVFAPRVGT